MRFDGSADKRNVLVGLGRALVGTAVLLAAVLFVPGSNAGNDGPAPESKPRIGFQYITWFATDRPSGDCSGSGWRDRPFGLDEVRSLVFDPDPAGYCYSSMDPHTAEVHAQSLHELGADFVIIDDTNLSKANYPLDNPIFRSSKRAIAGFERYKAKTIEVVFQLSLTCFAESCHGGLPEDRREIYTYNDFIRAHIEEIAAMSTADPGRYVHLYGKPLLLFFVSQGSNVMNLDGTPAFHGPGNLIPTAEEFNPPITVGGVAQTLRDVFTVRYTIVAGSEFDYRPYSADIWPFQCNGDNCYFTEAGYASLYSVAWKSRSLAEFNRLVDAADDQCYLVVRTWNEFSSTDEHRGRSYTIEPNTRLHQVDSTPGNQDPWYFFNGIKARLNRFREYRLVAKHSGKCLDVAGTMEGAPIQQWSCLGRAQTNQVFYLIPYFPGYQIVAKHSDMCIDVMAVSVADGGSFQQYPCLGAAQSNQLWDLVPAAGGFSQLIARHSGKCADVTAVSRNDGALVQQYTCLGGGQANQLWWIERIR